MIKITRFNKWTFRRACPLWKGRLVTLGELISLGCLEHPSLSNPTTLPCFALILVVKCCVSWRPEGQNRTCFKIKLEVFIYVDLEALWCPIILYQ